MASTFSSLVRWCLLVLILAQGLYLIKEFSVPSPSSLGSAFMTNPTTVTSWSTNTTTTINETNYDDDDDDSSSSSNTSSSPPIPLEVSASTVGRKMIPLIDLVQTRQQLQSQQSQEQQCQKRNGILINDTIYPESMTINPKQWKIPHIVHLTSKSRCSSTWFTKNVNRWRKRMTNHSIYFHDEDAVDRLLQQPWPEFPHLQLVMNCLISGAAKADLWRYLVLWEYGGIYSDIDSAPGIHFNASTIQPTDDAFFIPEGLGVLSQYFMSASPKHPLMYMAVMETLNRLLNVPSVLEQYVPFVTGPGALKTAMVYFMESFPPPPSSSNTKKQQSPHPPYHRVPAGHYIGIHNRSITVRGSKETTNEWIRRTAVSGQKKRDGFATMGQTRFHDVQRTMKKKQRQFLNVSCFQHLHHISTSSFIP